MSSEIKVTNIKHANSGSNNLVLASDGSATIANGTLSAGAIGSSVTYPAISTASYTGADGSGAVQAQGSGVIRQVQTNQMRHASENNNDSFNGTSSGTGWVVCIDNVLSGSDILVSASFCWFIDTGNVAYFTFFKRYDSGSGFGAEEQVSVLNSSYGISGGVQHADGNADYDGQTDIATLVHIEKNCSAGRWQFELHRRSDNTNANVGVNNRGQNNNEIGTATFWAMELT